MKPHCILGRSADLVLSIMGYRGRDRKIGKEGRRRETKEEEMRREERKRSERVLGNHERVEQGERKIEEDNKGSCERSEGERGELKIQNTC